MIGLSQTQFNWLRQQGQTDFSGRAFTNLTISGNMSGVNFSGCHFQACQFIHANGEDVDFSQAILHEVRICDSGLRGAKFCEAIFYNTNVERSDLTGADLHSATIISTHFKELTGCEGAKLHRVRIFEHAGAPDVCAQLKAQTYAAFGIPMPKAEDTVYVLTHHWDTPDNEGNEVLGVYRRQEDAIADMQAAADKIRKEYDSDFWDADMTWESERDIHLGRPSVSGHELATIYCWDITEQEIQE